MRTDRGIAFVDTEHCRSRVHCRSCRATTAAGERFRAAMAELYEPPTDWLCPAGMLWDSETPPAIDASPPPSLVIAPPFCIGCPDERLFPDDARGCEHFKGNYNRPTPCAFNRAIERGEQCPRGNGPLNQPIESEAIHG